MALQTPDIQCVWLLSSLNTTANSMAKVCFDTNSPIVTNVTKFSAEKSNELLFSNVAQSQSMDQVWIVIAAALVFFMQTGFTMLEAGAVKNINVQNILFKNLMDACIGTIVWFLWGYTVAFGIYEDSNDFMGIGDMAVNESESWTIFYFQWTFAVTAATIVSGSVAGRCSLFSYGFYTLLLTSWVYPIIVHWIWDAHGWLSAFNEKIDVINGGVIDFAGSGVVHTVGGWAGLMGAIFLGPRIGRFPSESDDRRNSSSTNLAHEHKFGNNVAYQVMGTFFLWFGWYGFNCGSTLAANGVMSVASKVAVNTTLSAATGGIVSCLMTLLIENIFSVPSVVNGILAGLVSVTAPCAVIDPGSSIAIGLIGAILYFAATKLLDKLRIDDPLEAWPVHGVCGVWGVLSVAFFSESENIAFAGYNDDLVNASRGELFGNQLLSIVIIIAWTIVWIGGLFFILHKFNLLRVSKMAEKRGLDSAEHGGKAVRFNTVPSLKKQTSVFNTHLESIKSSKKSRNTRKLKIQPIDSSTPRNGSKGVKATNAEREGLKSTSKTSRIENILYEDDSDSNHGHNGTDDNKSH